DRTLPVSRGAGALAMSDPVCLLRHVRHQQDEEARRHENRYGGFACADIAPRPVERGREEGDELLERCEPQDEAVAQRITSGVQVGDGQDGDLATDGAAPEYAIDPVDA